MEKFLTGIEQFQDTVFPASRKLYEQLAEGQSPHTLYIGCSDSRVIPNELMQAPPGDLFICRTAGNIVPAWGDGVGGVGATIEYAVEVLKVKHIVIVGHSDCGAMKALIAPEKVQHLRAIAGWIRHAERVTAVARELHGDEDDPGFVHRLIEENVITQLDHLVTYPCVAAKMRSGNIFVHGLVFDIKTGTFTILDRTTNAFLPLKTALERRASRENVQV